MEKYMSNKKIILLFVTPTLLIFGTFILYPLLPTLYTAFFEFDGFTIGEFVGIDNFISTFTDPIFWSALMNTLKVLALQTFVGAPLSLFFALLVNFCGTRTKRYIKISYFMPTVLNITVICLMWKMIFQPTWGILDSVLSALGLESLIHTWLIDKETAIWCIGLVFVWQYLGYNMLLLYSGIRSIPESYIEASCIEGANFWTQSYYIVIPLLQEIIKFVLIISTTGTLAMFAHVQVLTSGGPGSMTRTLVYQLYYKGYQMQDFGEANAIAIIFATMGIVIFILINKFVARNRIEMV